MVSGPLSNLFAGLVLLIARPVAVRIHSGELGGPLEGSVIEMGPIYITFRPMYLGLVTAILGQVLLFGSLGVLIYAVIAWLVAALFVRWYEEPTSARQFGADYEAYRRAVSAWWPRLRSWDPGGTH